MSIRNPSMKNEGEGVKSAARRYNEGATALARSGTLEAAARDARDAVERDEAEELRAAEERGKAAIAEEDPAILGVLRLGRRPEIADLPPDARRRALQRAAELMAQGCQIGRACRIAGTAARVWLDGGRRAPALPGPAQHVMYEHDAWLICPEDRPVPSHAFDRMSEAMATAEDIAAQRCGAVYLYDVDGELCAEYESYGGAFDEPHAIHVVERDGLWVLERTAEPMPLARYADRVHALREARSRARDEHSAVIVHHEPGDGPEPLCAA